MEEKLIYQNEHGKIVRLTDMFGGSRYILFDADGNYLRDIPSVFCVEKMPELFPTLAG
jgi:hypothetical protein